MLSQEWNHGAGLGCSPAEGWHPEGPTSLSLLPRFGMSRLATVPVFAPQDEEANHPEEEDEEMWKDGDSGHQMLGKAQSWVGDIAFQGEGLFCPVGIQGMRLMEQRG